MKGPLLRTGVQLALKMFSAAPGNASQPPAPSSTTCSVARSGDFCLFLGYRIFRKIAGDFWKLVIFGDFVAIFGLKVTL